MKSTRPLPQQQEEINLKIAQLVGIAWAIYPRYGENTENLKLKISGFQMILRHYNLELIEQAFEEYFARGKEFPVPADIVKIINPAKEPLSQAVYIELVRQKKAGGVYITDEEKAYMREFEKQEIKKFKNNLRQDGFVKIDSIKQTFIEDLKD